MHVGFFIAWSLLRLFIPKGGALGLGTASFPFTTGNEIAFSRRQELVGLFSVLADSLVYIEVS